MGQPERARLSKRDAAGLGWPLGQHADSRLEPIAIIGVHGRFPGADNLAGFWDNLVQRRDSISLVPPQRWDWRACFGDAGSADKTSINKGGFIEDFDKFDARFFGIAEREAKLMDPLQRLALESAWHCIEDAGYRTTDLAESETGVFVATGKSDYEELLYRNGAPIDARTATGVATSIIANRISFALGLTGPSLSIDTACSGSLAALHTAAQSLRNDDCSVALVTAVNVMLTPTLTISLEKEGTLSPDCQTKSFDAAANGYARGEGVVSLLLKKLADAERDRDHIYGVLRGSAISHGGRANWLTAPNAAAQQKLIEKAVRRAGVDPRTVTYIEAHGTGTPLGDPIEFNAIRQAYAALLEERGEPRGIAHRCGIGSVKANIGHLEAASGLAGIVKVLLSMKHGRLPGNPHLNAVNRLCKTEGTPFYFTGETQSWERVHDENGTPFPRRAGVSSFGFGGAYGHVVLEEYADSGDAEAKDREPEAAIVPVLAISAKDRQALLRYARLVHDFVAKQVAERVEPSNTRHEPTKLEDFLYTFQVGRNVMPARLAIIGDTWQALAGSLARFLDGEHDPNVVTSDNCEMRDSAARSELEDLSSEFARRWVKNQNIDFKAFYSGGHQPRVSAPTYPFARTRFWLDERSAPSE